MIAALRDLRLSDPSQIQRSRPKNFAFNFGVQPLIQPNVIVKGFLMKARSPLGTDLNPPPGTWAIDLPAGSPVLKEIAHALAAAQRCTRKAACHQIGFSVGVVHQELLNIFNS